MPMPQSGAPPLQGVKVVDFSRIIAGPLCTQVLADMGAEVVKIENPATGDDTRRMAEPGVAGKAISSSPTTATRRASPSMSARRKARKSYSTCWLMPTSSSRTSAWA